MKSKCLFWAVLSGVVLFLWSGLFSVSARENKETQRDVLDEKIKSLQEKIADRPQKVQKIIWKELRRLHKKRVRLDLFDTDSQWEFIRDDFKYGNTGFALHLLTRMNTNESILKLMELNNQEILQGKKIRRKEFTLKRWLNLYRKVRFLNVYKFGKGNLKSLKRSLNMETLTPDQKLRLSNIEQPEIPEPEKTMEKEEAPFKPEPEEAPETPIRKEAPETSLSKKEVETSLPKKEPEPSLPKEEPKKKPESPGAQSILDAERIAQVYEEEIKREMQKEAEKIAEELKREKERANIKPSKP